MEMVVAALATCSGITAVEILSKMRQPVLSFEIVASGERAEQRPRPWTRIHLEYRLSGACDLERAERAVELAETKHCPVAKSLSPDLALSHHVVRVGHDIRRITAAETHQLRQSLLRPHQRLEEMRYPGDDDPDSVHLGGFLEGRLSGILSLRQAGNPDFDLGERPFKLRGMATVPEVRGSGLGAALLANCIQYARLFGGTAVWCNARRGAVGFYGRGGFQTLGEVFEVPVIGPHVVMVHWLGPPAP